MSKLDRTKKKPKQQKEVDQPASAGKPTGSPGLLPATRRKLVGDHSQGCTTTSPGSYI